jgi:hypothetical protein
MTDTENGRRRLANDNPWYCLATLHGEQPFGQWDKELAEKNCLTWNRWFGDITEGQRIEIAKSFSLRLGT